MGNLISERRFFWTGSAKAALDRGVETPDAAHNLPTIRADSGIRTPIFFKLYRNA
jgi:hypothetical protein